VQGKEEEEKGKSTRWGKRERKKEAAGCGGGGREGVSEPVGREQRRDETHPDPSE